MKIFISHSSRDDEFVKKIEKILHHHSIQSWADHNELKDWDSFRTEIKINIDDSDLFLLIWSQDANNSPYVKQELDLVNSEEYVTKIQKVVFNIDGTELYEEYEDRLYRSINENNLEEQIEDIIFSYSKELDLFFKIFKHIIQKQFRNNHHDPLIKNFKNFNAYKYYIRQRYLNQRTDETGSNIVDYVLKLINKKYSIIEEKKRKLHKIDSFKEKLKQIHDGDPILVRKKSLTEKNLKETISERKDLTQNTKKNIQSALQIIQDINDIKKNLKQHNKEILIPIIGDYGSGKSAFCHYLLYELCKDSDSKFDPIFIPLRVFSQNSYDKYDKLLEDIFDYACTEYRLKITKDEFKKEISDGKIIFVLDGLDEMADKLDDTIAQNNLNHIIRLAQNTPVILTSRETYLSGEMEKKLFQYDEVIKILDFSESEIKEYLERYVSDQNERHQINKIVEERQIEELAKKPLFLFVICQNHKYLRTQSRINESAILEVLTDAWIEHDVEKYHKLDLEKQQIKNDRRRISEVLAFREYAKPKKPIAKDDILEEVEKEFKNDNAEFGAKESLDKYYADAVRATFLIKEGDDTYRFIARPVTEYFVAKRIIHDIEKNRTDSLIQHANMIKTRETFDFIKGIAERYWAVKPFILNRISQEDPSYQMLKAHEDMGDRLFDLTTKYKGESTDVGSLVKILYITGNLPPKCDLSDLTLGVSYLTNADFRETLFSKSRMQGAHLSGSDLSYANLVGSNLSYSLMIGSNLTKADFTKSILRNANLLGANLSGTILNGARFVNVYAPIVIINEDPQVEGIVLVKEEELKDKVKVVAALNKLDKKLRQLIVEKNPKYRV